MRAVKEREKFTAVTLKCWENTLPSKHQTEWFFEIFLALTLREIKRTQEIVRVQLRGRRPLPRRAGHGDYKKEQSLSGDRNAVV